MKRKAFTLIEILISMLIIIIGIIPILTLLSWLHDLNTQIYGMGKVFDILEYSSSRIWHTQSSTLASAINLPYGDTLLREYFNGPAPQAFDISLNSASASVIIVISKTKNSGAYVEIPIFSGSDASNTMNLIPSKVSFPVNAVMFPSITASASIVLAP